MDDIKDPNTTDWVQSHLAALAPPAAWEPDNEHGRRLFEAQQHTARRRRTIRQGAVLGILIVGTVLVMMPSTRGIAERLLNRFTTRNVAAVRSNLGRFDLQGLLPRAELTKVPGAMHRVTGVAQAERDAGFAPRLPMEFIDKIAAGSIVLGVRGPAVGRIRVNVADLRAGLRKRGIDNVEVPSHWDGMEITYKVSPSIGASFKDGALTQLLPPVLTAPADLVIADFVEIGLRIAGLSASEARTLRGRFAESGSMLTIVPSDAKYSFREVELARGHGMVFENDTDYDESDLCGLCPGPHELVLRWATPDRVFILKTPTLSVEEAIALANSIDKP